MESEFYSLTSGYVILFDIITAVMVIQLFRLFGASSKLTSSLVVTFTVWLGTLLLLIPSKNLFPEDLGEIYFFVILISGVALITGATFFSPVGKFLLNTVPHEYLLFPQGLRAFFGAGFIIEAVLGIMPPVFGILDGITHITAAFLAMSAAIILKSPWKNKFSIWLAHLFGLLDIFVVALGISFFLLKDISVHHNVMYAAFFAAPIFITFHLVAIIKLIKEKNI